MPLFLKTTRNLRKAPNGDKGDVTAEVGEEVSIIEEADSWAHVKLEQGIGEGWVPSNAVDSVSPAGAVPDTIDPDQFIRHCWREGIRVEVSPHYLVAVAKLRSGIRNDKQNGNTGPFRLTGQEWKVGRDTAAFGVSDFLPSDIRDWGMQVTMFAAMTHATQEALNAALGHVASWHELYLAQMIGPNAAAAAVKTAANKIDPALGIQGGDERYVKYLLDPAPTPATGENALNKIATDLQGALDEVKDAVVRIGNEVLADQPTDEIVADAKKPPQPKAEPQPQPQGPAATLIAGAGGPLGQLIAAHESGRLGYNAFNRGIAGDAKVKMNFATMTLGAIMRQQALPRRDPNRLFAVGKYQLIPDTMKDAAAKLRLDPNQMFTPELQETLFRNYLVAIKRPAVKQFITGHGTLNAAQMALAFEFASVARPDTGRSQYGGVGGNRASTTAQQTATALQKEKAMYAENIKTMSPADAWNALSK